jgi:hypothetical protein
MTGARHLTASPNLLGSTAAQNQPSLSARPIRAPSEHGATVIEPPPEAVGAVVERNVRQRERWDYDVQGRSLASLAEQARRELVTEAERYTATYRNVVPTGDLPLAGKRVFLAGHQPQLFHPGVWYKNFALGALAREHNGVAINLVIDSDTIKGASIRVPDGSVDAPVVHTVEFDGASEEIPFEERSIVDGQKFEGFRSRVAKELKPLVREPLVHHYWPLVLGRAAETDNLGACLAQGRHLLEGQWGLETLELPQSHVCQTEAFYWFTAHLLAHLPRLWDIYNASVHEYRRTYRVRSANHPVPDLASEGDWLEAPFWLWTADAPHRQRLFVRQRGSELILANRHGLEIPVPLSPDGEVADAVAVLASLPGRGIKLRTRALLTTLFARLLGGDLFLHGIGGGKYDELTDLLIARFFGLEPPGFMVISATLHLPIENAPPAQQRVTRDDQRRVEHELRELEFHPERYIDATGNGQAEGAVQWIARKREAIASTPTPTTARSRCRTIRGVNNALQPWVDEQRKQLLAERDQIIHWLRAKAILASREYAFCLYPEQSLRNFMLAFPPRRL